MNTFLLNREEIHGSFTHLCAGVPIISASILTCFHSPIPSNNINRGCEFRARGLAEACHFHWQILHLETCANCRFKGPHTAQLARFLINLAAREMCKSRFLLKVLTSFSVYNTFNDEVFEVTLWRSFTKPLFSSFCSFFCSFFHNSIPPLFNMQCRLDTSMNPAPASSCGRKGQPFCKAMSSTPPVWVGGRWTSITS